MADNEASAAPARESLSISSRYQAAWGEHGLRISQRQGMIQWYLGVAGAIYGYWFTHRTAEMHWFLVVTVTLLTLATSLQVWMHNRVLQQLVNFMSDCEACSATSIRECGGGKHSLFYFFDSDKPRGGGVDKFHGWQRRLNRGVLVIILGATNGIAIHVTWGSVHGAISALSVVGSVLSVGLMFIGLWRDDGNQRRED
jgi:hypothetical protein